MVASHSLESRIIRYSAFALAMNGNAPRTARDLSIKINELFGYDVSRARVASALQGHTGARFYMSIPQIDERRSKAGLCRINEYRLKIDFFPYLIGTLKEELKPLFEQRAQKEYEPARAIVWFLATYYTSGCHATSPQKIFDKAEKTWGAAAKS